ncbi:MAG: histone deacetylase family protein [Solirubrobacteraceae bacterium]
MADAPVLLEHPSSLTHDTGPHPEQAARIVAIDRELADRDWLGYECLPSPEAERSALAAVHSESHIAAIEAASLAGGAHLDPDTVVSSGSFEAALHGAGGAVALVDLLLGGSAPCGFSAHRPPGHHAERARAMGFCLFNNVAVAARHALDAHGLERVMILDWDVHHGNGTNDIFSGERRVLFVSIHQSPLYPGTGPAADVGSGDGIGYTVNLPVAPGSGDAVFCSLVDGVAVPLARAFAPQLVLISAGFDAHRDDPLADCRVTEAGFAAMTASMRDVGAELQAPLGGVLEGGYALGALARSVAATLEALSAAPGVGPGGSGVGPGGSGGPAMVPEARAARGRLAQWWPSLALS